MVTNYPHEIASSESETVDHSDTDHVDTGVGTSVGMLGRMRQWLCSLHGHDMLLQFEHDRLFLRCVSCGHESPGWALTGAPPRMRVRGDAHHHRLTRPQRADIRRIA